MSVTLKDIARETGLSIATVSKYINGASLREKNRAAIEQAIKKLGYTVNEFARGLKSNKSRSVGVVIPELSNLFITRIITDMEEILRAHGYSVIICDCHTNETLECEAVEFLLSKMVDGIVNMPVCKDGRHLSPAMNRNLPILLLDRPIPALGSVTDSVLIDNQGAASMAVEHLIANGHRSIGIVTGSCDIFTFHQRLEGYRNSLALHGIPADERLISHGDFTIQGGYESMRRLLDAGTGMSAVFVTNYEMTLGSIIALNERGVSIPEELSFIGFDNLDLSRVTHPKLTIVAQPLREIGTQAAHIILERLTSHTGAPKSLSLSVSLQQGDSVKNLRPQP